MSLRSSPLPDDVKRFTRLLTQPLARTPTPPRRLEVRVGRGFHLLLQGAGQRLLHVTVDHPGAAVSAPIRTDHAWMRFRCARDPTETERTWLGALKQGLRRMDRVPDWPAFVGWSAEQPAAMLPDATFDPDRDPPSGNLELIRIETRCNGRCGFCSARGILPDLVEDTEQIVQRFRGMRKAGRRSVALTGGEPTLRQDLPELIALARDEGFTAISLLTNAMRLDRGPLLGRLVEAGLTSVFVPFLSHRAEVHDELLGVAGAFERTVAGVDRCRDAGLELAYNTVVTAPNVQDLEPLMAWIAQRFPAPSIPGNISYVAPQGWALDHPELVPRLDAVRPHLQAALDTCERLGMGITIPGLCGVPMCILPGYEERFEEFHRGFQGMPENRRYAAVCQECAVQDRCSGFWSVYFEWFGEAELGYPPGTLFPA
ncbi:MAG: radical SAM protein [bacterium]